MGTGREVFLHDHYICSFKGPKPGECQNSVAWLSGNVPFPWQRVKISQQLLFHPKRILCVSPCSPLPIPLHRTVRSNQHTDFHSQVPAAPSDSGLCGCSDRTFSLQNLRNYQADCAFCRLWRCSWFYQLNWAMLLECWRKTNASKTKKTTFELKYCNKKSVLYYLPKNFIIFALLCIKNFKFSLLQLQIQF